MTTLTCHRSGCAGTIVDGVCEDCGRPAQGQSLLAAAPATRPVSVATPSPHTSSYPASRATSAVTGKTTRRQSGSSSQKTSSRRRALGGGLVSLPEMPSQDPLKLLMAVPAVPDKKRRCPSCDHKVNRSKGFCPNCGQEYNFEPALKTGDIVNGKFEVKGPIAFGGLGWIYLAWDQQLSRWVILKGLLNAKDEASAAAAVAERQYLAAVKHPKIVGIYDFVNHGNEGFIVMEYVGGRTLESLRKDQDLVDVTDAEGRVVRLSVKRAELSEAERGMTVTVTRKGLLAPEEAIAYLLGILPAFAYLHANKLVYCDFKPDNVMLEGDDVKLIDMGGVRRIGDPDGDIYGTRGYMAPEAADDPVVESDLYTLGRALATLVMDFAYLTEFENSLPLPAAQPVLQENEALYRFLLRATHPDPDCRFESADEMSDQLLGVLREMVALKGDPKPAESKAFTADNLQNADDAEALRTPLARVLPGLRVDPDDEAAEDILRLGNADLLPVRLGHLQQLVKQKPASMEARLRLADSYLASGMMEPAKELLWACGNDNPYDWRINWLYGVRAFMLKDYGQAQIAFNKVYDDLPGEVAPKLALAFAAEADKEWASARSLYDRVSRIDPHYVSACFGLARVEAACGRLEAAAEALGRIPANHSLSQQARLTLARLLLEDEARLDAPLLQKVDAALREATAEGSVTHSLAARLLTVGLALLQRGVITEAATFQLLGHRVGARTLQLAAEAEYRQCARYAQTPEEKTVWVDLANRVRPFTLF